jgi:hypothetical protein
VLCIGDRGGIWKQRSLQTPPKGSLKAFFPVRSARIPASSFSLAEKRTLQLRGSDEHCRAGILTCGFNPCFHLPSLNGQWPLETRIRSQWRNRP